MKSVKVGILGLGTVGSGVYDLLRCNGELLQRRSNLSVEVVKTVDMDASKERELGLPPGVFSRDASEVLDNEEIQIVVELIGGTGAARELTL
jgi:homoserine dehydrogenase